MKVLTNPRIVLGNLTTLIPWTLSVLALAALAGCSSPDDSVDSSDDSLKKGGAKQGQTCASGVFGTPNIACARGLVCEYPNDSTAPSGPSGSSSASTGTCQLAGAKQGETCASGVFGTPNIACAHGLVCQYPNDSTAPSGPSGSSSASTGTCQPAGAKQGETCASGVFGTPDLPCADGLVCRYPNDSTAPAGPSGSSSASTGTCQAK